jgi:Cdc6-like AAA superfamily ATPase
MPIIKLLPQFFNHDAQAGGFFPNTHINQSFDIEKFIWQRGKNSIIEGIRGTGKTHILKMVAERYIELFSQCKVLPVYVSLARLSQFSEDDIKRFRTQLYANIVLESINCIEQHKEALGFTAKVEAMSALSLLKKLFGIKPEADFEDTIQEIKQLNQTLLQKLTYNPKNISMRQADTAKSGLQTTLTTPAGSAAAEISAESETEQKVDFIGTNLSHENAAEFILEYFKQLRKILSHFR